MEINFKFKFNNQTFIGNFEVDKKEYKKICKAHKSERERLVKSELARQHIEIIEMELEEY